MPAEREERGDDAARAAEKIAALFFRSLAGQNATEVVRGGNKTDLRPFPSAIESSASTVSFEPRTAETTKKKNVRWLRVPPSYR